MVGHGQLGSLPGGIATASSSRHEIVETAAQFRHRGIDREKILRRDGTKGHHDFRLDHRDLPHEKWRAGITLVSLRSAVPRWTALHNVRDVDLFALQAHRLDHVVQQLSGAANERLSLHVFVGSWTFADKHELGIGIAHAKDDLLTSLLVQLPARAVAQVLTDQLQGGYRIGDALLCFRCQNFKDVLFDWPGNHRGFSWGHFLSQFRLGTWNNLL